MPDWAIWIGLTMGLLLAIGAEIVPHLIAEKFGPQMSVALHINALLSGAGVPVLLALPLLPLVHSKSGALFTVSSTVRSVTSLAGRAKAAVSDYLPKVSAFFLTTSAMHLAISTVLGFFDLDFLGSLPEVNQYWPMGGLIASGLFLIYLEIRR